MLPTRPRMSERSIASPRMACCRVVREAGGIRRTGGGRPEQGHEDQHQRVVGEPAQLLEERAHRLDRFGALRLARRALRRDPGDGDHHVGQGAYPVVGEHRQRDHFDADPLRLLDRRHEARRGARSGADDQDVALPDGRRGRLAHEERRLAQVHHAVREGAGGESGAACAGDEDAPRSDDRLGRRLQLPAGDPLPVGAHLVQDRAQFRVSHSGAVPGRSVGAARHRFASREWAMPASRSAWAAGSGACAIPPPAMTASAPASA